MTLYRAIAYQLQPLDTPYADLQPECCVFFEAHTSEAAPALLLRLLALAWGCTPAEVEFYNLHSERELLQAGRDDDGLAGDAALWISGNYHGPTFHRTDRTLLLVRPSTLERLLQAHQETLPLRALQRRAVVAAALAKQEQQRQSNWFKADLAQQLRGAPRAGA